MLYIASPERICLITGSLRATSPRHAHLSAHDNHYPTLYFFNSASLGSMCVTIYSICLSLPDLNAPDSGIIMTLSLSPATVIPTNVQGLFSSFLLCPNLGN